MAEEAALSTPLLGARAAGGGDRRANLRRVALLAALAAALVLALAWSAAGQRRARREDAQGPALLISSGLTRDFCQRDARNEAGYVKLPHKDDDWYFYWYFEARHAPKTAPLVLWLSGGPGCSSLYTLLTENGPCSVMDDLSTKRNPFSWNNEANVIWLDQPTDVGYSRGEVGEYDHSEDEVQDNIYAFLLGFMSKHPELEHRPFFIAGESYAGHYVPAAAHYIWLQSKKAGATALKLNLQGIAIGNGLVNPAVQSKHGLDMVNNSYNVTLMDPATLEGAKKALPQCTALIDSCQSNTTVCLDAALFCESNVEAAFGESHRNSFDIRKQCDEADPMNCYNASAVTRYLNSPLVRAYLNVSEGEQAKTWESCSSAVGMGFAFDVMKRFDHYVGELLDSGRVRVLVYHGDADLVCNWCGGLAWVQELEWKHRDAFKRAKERPFLVGKGGHFHSASQVGVVRSFENQLTFVRAYNAGHFMPMDQPAVALEMITRFLKGQVL